MCTVCGELCVYDGEVCYNACQTKSIVNGEIFMQ